jgi:6-pyruvoyltetrahydropterin/6-carboxytetrahydropterin synthase
MPEITRTVYFETAHLLHNHGGKCKNLHGHSFRIDVTVSGPVNLLTGMVIDFKELDVLIKDVVPDHCLILNAGRAETENTVECALKTLAEDYALAYKLYPGMTTSENLVEILAKELEEQLQLHDRYLHVAKCVLWETVNSSATWERKSVEL